MFSSESLTPPWWWMVSYKPRSRICLHPPDPTLLSPVHSFPRPRWRFVFSDETEIYSSLCPSVPDFFTLVIPNVDQHHGNFRDLKLWQPSSSFPADRQGNTKCYKTGKRCMLHSCETDKSKQSNPRSLLTGGFVPPWSTAIWGDKARLCAVYEWRQNPSRKSDCSSLLLRTSAGVFLRSAWRWSCDVSGRDMIFSRHMVDQSLVFWMLVFRRWSQLFTG